MFFPTDILRAALCCVADDKETREYLKGVYITPTHIKATNGWAAVMMEHGAETDIDGVFIVHGEIPVNAEGTAILQMKGKWYASHLNEDEEVVGYSTLEHIECQYPDFTKILPNEEALSAELPMFSMKALSLPHRMFSTGVAGFKPTGKSGVCLLTLDPITNRFYGNPKLVIMPVKEDAFDMLQAVIDEN
ncbi:hypothetical protein G3M83_07115 [Rouxiella badensis]|uniref:hypothetical protein n=1 Tax=Rouxiella badensis TaxID=1646377 RepID=UPI0013EF325A|nr:hypothetical protein [Rouxiella badensis]QII37483.1 hypothetical protein G3M83_07115 [Rouxiella badensis]